MLLRGRKVEEFMSNEFFNPKPVNQLTFTDDGMFQAVLHQENVCADLIERLLHVKVSRVGSQNLKNRLHRSLQQKESDLMFILKTKIKLSTLKFNATGRKP